VGEFYAQRAPKSHVLVTLLPQASRSNVLWV